MFKLDDNLLRELGLGTLPAAEKNRMLQHIYETLEMRVGMKLAEQMTNEQLDEFEGFIDRNDEQGALKLLEANFPNYKQVVADELEALKTEIKGHASAIVEASHQQVAAVAQGQPAPGQQTTAQAQPDPQQYQPPQAPQYQPPEPQPPAQPDPQQYQPPRAA